jgi:ornithine cyclodeaminase/alanine dehydrogenase-like protein (mu-crystallin family)
VSAPLFLDEAAVRRHLRMDALVPAVRDALASLSAGGVVQPVRTVVPVAEHAGFLGAMPAYAGDALGAKLVTFYPGNRDVHTHHAVIVLFRPETGEPAAVLDGRLITEMRTAAASAVATDALARPDARVLGILGAGVQARSHLEALRLVRPLDEVRVWSPRRARAFAEEMGGDVRAVDSAAEAVRGADVVLVATTSQTPVLQGAWLAPGTHVNAVGATRPDWRELDDAAVRSARLFVDSRVAALRESGDVMAAEGEPAELGEVILGKLAGRRSPDEITLFKSVGVAVEDLVAAALVYRAAS